MAELTAALDDTAIGRVLLEAGTYPLISPLLIGRSVVLAAAQPGTVVLDGQNVSRVLSIRGGGWVGSAVDQATLAVEELSGLDLAVERQSGLDTTMPAVELIGLAITRGFSAIGVAASLSPCPISSISSMDIAADRPCCVRRQ